MQGPILFSVISTILVLTLSPLLSAVGLSVCPIMRSHGFLFGCNINFNFIMSLLLWNLATGNVAIALNRWLKKWPLPYLEKSVFFNALFLLLSFLGLLHLHANALHSIAQAGSPYSAQISAILFSAGLAVVLLQTALIDLLSIHSLDNSGEAKSGPTTQLWNNLLAIGGPLLVFGGMFYFMASLLDAQVDGWDTLDDQKPRLIWAGALFFLWYLLYYFALNLSKMRILKSLESQAQSLKMPDSKAKVSVARTAELKFVALALNEARDVINERTHLLSNFSKFVSDRLIEQVVRSEDLSLEGRTTKAAIIMTDLRDFTAISQQLSPTDVVRMLNIYFDSMIQVLHKNEIIVDKFIGDGLLAYRVDQAHESGEESSTKALQASFQMIQALTETNQILKEHNLPQLKIGIGIHYGDVVLGAVGSKSRMQYIII